jgi:hypothetical protein
VLFRSELAGYVHFRFTVQGEVLDEMAGETCLFIIDIHLDKSVQRKGLGKHLHVLLELIARRERMSRLSVPLYKGDSASKTWLEKCAKGYINDESYANIGFDANMEVLYDVYDSKTLP